MTSLQDASVCIVGLGLMGGSLAAALSRTHSCRQVIGVARRAETLSQAQTLGYIAEGYLDLLDALPSSDVVILATPVRDIIAQIGRLHAAKPGTMVLDLGSTKQQVCAALESLPVEIDAVGGHPMCGKASSGLSEADPDLYRDKVFVLCPTPRTSPAAMELGRQLVTAIGAHQLVLDAERHDQLVALISHLPYLAAAALVNAVSEAACEDELVWQLASSGFRDTTRLAASDITMMLDILITNRQPILSALAHAQAQLAQLGAALEANDSDVLVKLLSSARAQRKEMFT
ncbi:MAG: prephenate dehydrogenase [Anaerolineae bacterium]